MPSRGVPKYSGAASPKSEHPMSAKITIMRRSPRITALDCFMASMKLLAIVGKLGKRWMSLKKRKTRNVRSAMRKEMSVMSSG